MAQQKKRPVWRYASGSLQERNEIKAGTLVMHNSHPCATPLGLMTKKGLSWNVARNQLVSRHAQSWDAKPGQATLLGVHHELSCCMFLALCSLMHDLYSAASGENERAVGSLKQMQAQHWMSNVTS